MAKKIEALEILKSITNWICWKSELRAGDEKPTKIPKNPHTGGNASSTNPATWGTFIQAVRAAKKYEFDGLGWVFTDDAGIIGIDLDNCLDTSGRLSPWARDIVDSIRSYTEISPSGRGLHIFARALIPKSLGPAPDSRVEMYSKSRYFTMTGNILPGSFEKIADRQKEVEALWQAESKQRRKTRSPLGGKKDHSIRPVTDKAAKLKAYTEKAYLEEIGILNMATAGCRNDSLNRCAFNLGQFIQAGLLSQTEVETTLQSIATQLGLCEREAWATIQSGINGGINNPRDWPSDEPDILPTLPPPPLPKNDEIYHQAIEPHLALIKGRWGLSRRTVDLFKVGYCPACPTSPYSPSFTAPYYDAKDLLDIRHHLLSPNGQGKYRPEIEGYPVHLFNSQAIGEEDWLIMVNREFATMLLYGEYDLPVVGLPSKFRREWLAQFDKLNRVYIALDPGQETAAQQIARLLAAAGTDARVCSLPFSPGDMIVKYGCSLGDFIKFVEQGWGVNV